MSQDLTPQQQILLWDLVSRGGSALQGELKQDASPAVREPLVQAKLISVTKTKKRANVLTVGERGWHHIASVAPTLLKSGDGSKYDRPILQFVLAKMQAYAARKEVSFAELFSEAIVEKIGHEDPGEVAESEPSVIPIQTAIRSAFFDIAGRPARNQVRLRQLRERLSGIERGDLDAALRKMREAGRARFSTLTNPPDIAEEGDAALDIKNVFYHTIWIDP